MKRGCVIITKQNIIISHVKNDRRGHKYQFNAIIMEHLEHFSRVRNVRDSMIIPTKIQLFLMLTMIIGDLNIY